MQDSRASKKTISATAILWLFMIGLLVLIISVTTVSFGWSLRAITSAIASHQPERYSELYFDDPAHLPSYAKAGKVQTIPYTVVNHEHSMRTYVYQTSVIIDGRPVTQTGTVSLADGQSVTLRLNFTIKKPNDHADITIKLLGTSLQLTYRSLS